MKRPEDLFNKVTDLVVRTFSCTALTLKECADFERKGILTASAFASVVTKGDAISPHEFLKILAHLRIVAEMKTIGNQQKRYFIPCVLNHVSESPGEDLKTDVIPLAIQFKCKHCPKGLFGVLVTHLMMPLAAETKDSKISFKLRDDKIFRDQVSFYVDSTDQQDEISLKLHSLHVEITFYPELSDDRDVSISSVCNDVRKRIYQSIIISLEDLHYNRANVEPQVCIRCEFCSQLHEVKKGSSRITVFCEKGRKTLKISSQAGYWFSQGNFYGSFTELQICS